MAEKTAQRGRGWRRPVALKKALRALELVELSVGALLLLGILVLVMWQVLARVSPIPSEVWTGELARFALVWLALGLSGYLMGRDEHIALDVVDHVLPDLARRLVRAFSLLVVAATALTFAYEGYDLWSAGTPIKSPAARIPLGWIYFIPMVGMGLTALRAVIEIVFPVDHAGQIRVAGEVIATAPLDLLDDEDRAVPDGPRSQDQASTTSSSSGVTGRSSL